MAQRPEVSSGEDIQALKDNIRRTRADMSATIDELHARLDPDVLKAQIKDTVRERVDDAKQQVREATIGRAENMARKAGETVTEVRHGMMDTIRENPIPAAMVGIGLGWLLMNGRSTDRHRTLDDGTARGGYWPQVGGGGAEYYGTESYRGSTDYRAGYTRGQADFTRGEGMYTRGESGYTQGEFGGQVYGEMHTSGQYTGQNTHDGSTAHRVAERVGNVTGDIREKVGDAAGRVQEAGSHFVDHAHHTVDQLNDQAHHVAAQLAEEARMRAHRIEDRVGRTFADNPLGVGAAALAVGMAVGMALPRTRREDELIGRRRDALLERAEGVVDQGRERLRDVAETALEKVDEKVEGVATAVAGSDGRSGYSSTGTGSSGTGSTSGGSTSGSGSSGTGSTAGGSSYGSGSSGTGSTSGGSTYGSGSSGTGSTSGGSTSGGSSYGSGSGSTGTGSTGTGSPGTGSTGSGGSTR